MTRTFALLSLLSLIGCVGSGPASGPVLTADRGPLSGRYAGQDAGYLVIALAAKRGTSYTSYTLLFRSRDGSAKGAIWWGQQDPFDRRGLDIHDRTEDGIVDVRRLPPGDYEVYNFGIFLNGGTIQESFSSEQEFSVPFTIRPGGTTYIGEFLAAKLTGKNIFGIRVADGARFIVSNKAERDVPIAKQKEPGLGEAETAVVDADKVGNPLIGSSEP